MTKKLMLWLAERLNREQVEQATTAELEALAREPVRISRRKAYELIEQLRTTPGPSVRLGVTSWGDEVVVPLKFLIESCSVVTGGMGSGKSLFATLIIDALVERMPQMDTLSFGIVDAKGELFDRAIFILGRRLNELTGEAQQALLRRIVVIDFSARQAPTAFNILSRWPYTEEDFFITSRMETLRELLPAGEKLSLRGASVLKQALALLSEFGLPITYLGELLANGGFRHKLISRSENPEVRQYFERHLKQESPQTLAALRVRMETLTASEGVRLALTGNIAPDFRALQNDGKIVLVNCSGPSITRGVRMLLQGLVLSDIRQAVFARPTEPPVKYLWFADEAQNFFRSRQQVEDLSDLLTMARSFGSYFSLICQNLSTAVPDARILEILHTNTRWSMSFRGAPHDAQFLRPALPVTGRRRRPERHPFREPTMHSPEEERTLLLEGVASLPDFTGWWWPKSLCCEALRIRTELPDLPRGEKFEVGVRMIRELPEFGARLARADYERLIAERDREWRDEPSQETNLENRMKNAYREERNQWQM